MKPNELVLRLATDNDIGELFNWRNAPKSRMMSLNTEPISFDSHKLWFLNAKHDIRHVIYIAELNSIPVGSTRLFFGSDTEADISIVIDEKFQQRGLGLRILEMTIQELKKHHKEKVILYATIHKHNFSSINIFQKCGFVKDLSFENDSFLKYYLTLNS